MHKCGALQRLAPSHCGPFALQVLAQLAERRNAQPLPEVRRRHGLRLPPEEDCLLGGAYSVARGRRADDAPAAEPMDTDGCAPTRGQLVGSRSHPGNQSVDMQPTSCSSVTEEPNPDGELEC
jgi:hypothetical protein